MDAYLRVSRVKGREGESFISPAEQREQIEGWAKSRGVEIAEWHEDLDISGGKLDRPGLKACLERIESGATQGVVVSKLDRLSRLGVADALKLVERITDAGGEVAAIDVGLDPTTPVGKFARTLMLALAEMERDRFTEGWRAANVRAIERGVKISRVPFGYQRREDGGIEPDPIQGQHVIKAYELAGRSGLHAAQQYLSDRVHGRTWTSDTVRRMLARRTYLGESSHGSLVNLTAHEPLVSRSVWTAAQHEPRTMVRSSGAYPLSGIAICATCNSPMVASSKTRGGKRTYRCSGGQTLAKVRCNAPAAIVADRLEAYVVEYLRAEWEHRDWNVTSADPDPQPDAQRELEDAETELQAFAMDLTARRLLGATYHEALEARQQAVADALSVFNEQAKAETIVSISPEDIDTDDPEKLRELVQATFHLIEVKRGRGPLVERVRCQFVGSYLGGQVQRGLSNVLSP